MDKYLPLSIGIDLGASKIVAVLINQQGQILQEMQTPTEIHSGAKAIITRMAWMVQKLSEKTPGPVEGVGVGLPGYHDLTKGVVRLAVNLNWENIPLVALLKEKIMADIPVYFQNDANVEALGEYFFGSGKGSEIMAYIGIGSGLGGGIIYQGQIISGSTSTAGEMGHISLDPQLGRVCACGQRGCAETVVSGLGMVGLAQDLIRARSHQTRLSDDDSLTVRAIFQAQDAGDPLAAEVMKTVSIWLGQVMTAYVGVLNPDTIVIGGGIGRSAFDRLIPEAEKELRRRTSPYATEKLQIFRSQIQSSAVGASCLVWMNQPYAEPVWKRYKEVISQKS